MRLLLDMLLSVSSLVVLYQVFMELFRVSVDSREASKNDVYYSRDVTVLL